jgi:hypothetical protein
MAQPGREEWWVVARRFAEWVAFPTQSKERRRGDNLRGRLQGAGGQTRMAPQEASSVWNKTRHVKGPPKGEACT